jgi:hypothetical protein
MTSSNGLRFNYQIDPRGQKGGLSYYPFSGIISGLNITSAAVGGTNNVNLVLTVAAGAARLEGNYHSINSAISGLTIPTGVNNTTGIFAYDIWLNPQRITVASASAPSSPATDQVWIQVSQATNYLQVVGFFKYNGTAWVEFNPVRSTPPGYSHNNLPLNSINPVIDTTTTNNKSFFITPEQPIFHKSAQPIYVASPSRAQLRYNAGVKIARVSFVDTVATITNYSDTLYIPA